MSNDFLMQQYENEWKVYRGDSVYTPAFSIESLAHTKFRFEIRAASQNINGVINEEFSIYGHISNLKSGIKLNLHLWLYYGCNKLEILHFQKEIEQGIPEGVHVGSKTIQSCKVVCVGGSFQVGETDHFRHMKESNGAMMLKCRIHIKGHLGTIASYNQMVNSSQNRSEFSGNVSYIYEHQLHADLKIIIKDKCLPASKMFLAAHSPVFKKMLEHEFLESKTNTVTITDCSFEIFDIFLKYLYTGEIPGCSEGNIEELFAVADKYDVGSLRKECVRIMALDINLHNVCKIFRLAHECGNDGIKTQLKSFIIENYSSVKNTSEWTDLVETQPRLGFELFTEVHSSCHFP